MAKKKFFFYVTICLLAVFLFQQINYGVYIGTIKQQGIYEVENTFFYSNVNNMINAFFVICEPPDNVEDLEKLIKEFIKEKDIINSLIEREKDISVYGAYFAIRFLKPSKKYPIGWKPEKLDIDNNNFVVGNILASYSGRLGELKLEINN